jgi:hypothetical protein
MDLEVIEAFKTLADCHKDSLIEAARRGDEVVWLNLCNIYGFRGDEVLLKQYLLSQTSVNRG